MKKEKESSRFGKNLLVCSEIMDDGRVEKDQAPKKFTGEVWRYWGMLSIETHLFNTESWHLKQDQK